MEKGQYSAAAQPAFTNDIHLALMKVAESLTIETCLFMQRADMAWESVVHDSPASPAKVSLLLFWKNHFW